MEQETVNTEVQTDTAETVEAQEAPKETTKTFTQAELDAIVNARLAKAEKSISKRLADEQAEAKRQAELSAGERAKELEAANAKLQAEYETKIMQAERKAALAGKVSNPDRILRLIDEPADYFEGSMPNLERIIADFPEYAPKANQGTPLGGQPLSNKSAAKPTSLADAITQELFKGS